MRSANPLPAWGLLAVLLACAITFYLLVPNQRRLLTRLVQDGKAQRALDVLRSVSQSEIGKDPEFYELMRLRLNRQILDSKDRTGAIAHVEASLQAIARFPGNKDFLAEVLESISMLDDCAQALKLVAPHLKALPHAARQMLIEALVRDALASNQAEVAAEIHENCLRPFPPAETNLVEAVRLWRAAARPDRAIRVLEGIEQHSGKRSFALGPELMELKFNLLREVGRNSEAFDLASSFIGQGENGAISPKWMQRMRVTADSAAQRRTLLKAYRQDVQANPTDAGTWRLIAEIAVADDVELAKEALRKLISLMPGDAKAQRQLAQLYEWNGQPNLAFELYLKLSEQNDLAALERLIALNPGLYRDKDLLRPLRALSGEAHQEKYRLTLARLLIKHGEYAEANSLYQMHLQQHPDDAAVMEEYGRTLQRQQAYESALSTWKSLQKLRPEDETVRGHIAEVYFLLGDFENSLRTYQQLAKRSTDLGAILKYVTLADSLGELQCLGEAIARAMELKKQAAPEDFVKLAYALNLLGADAKRQGVLERGLTIFPTNDTLRVQLAVLLVEKDEGAQALPIMARSHNLKTDLNALRLYLELLIGSGKYATAEAFLKTGIAEKLLNTQSIVLLQAIIYEGNQNNAAAERIHENLYRQYPGETPYALSYLRILVRLGKAPEARKILQSLLKAPTPEILREAARVHAELGDFKEAEKLQARAMEPLGKASLQDWSDLGDIRFSAGNRSAARRAYRQALVAAGINLRSQPP